MNSSFIISRPGSFKYFKIFLILILDQDNNHRYWLGGNDFDQRHQFVWTNGQPLSGGLTWNQGEPNDYLTHERCLDFTYAFGSLALNDDDCSKKLYFICEE